MNWAIERKLTQLPEQMQLQPVSGGSINQTALLTFADRKPLFIKYNSGKSKTFFQAEAEGLKALAEANCVRVPRVIEHVKLPEGDQHAGEWFLILEAVEQGSRCKGFEEVFGHQLALLHQSLTDESFGFNQDNFIGATPQMNTYRMANWSEFFITQRLLPQLQMARDSALLSSSDQQIFDEALPQIQSVLPSHCTPTLIHGDLWSGNLLADERGEPVLIDPAVYYAHHEAEFGMTRLFGGFSSRFDAAYQEVHPFEAGAEERIPAYTLYHVLNHLNLFGSSYLASALQIARKYR